MAVNKSEQGKGAPSQPAKVVTEFLSGRDTYEEFIRRVQDAKKAAGEPNADDYGSTSQKEIDRVIPRVRRIG